MSDLRAIHAAASVTLDDLRNPARLAELSRDQIAALLAQCRAVEGSLLAELLRTAPATREADDDKLLAVEQASLLLAVPRAWVYRHARQLKLAVRLGDGTLRVSHARLQRLIRSNLTD